MRSIDRYIQRHKENQKSTKQEQNPVLDWDFIVQNSIPRPSKKFPIALDQADGEDDIKKFERYIRQLGRAILSCSLCKRGQSMMECDHVRRIPHFQPTIWHKNYCLIKEEPKCSDIGGLFDNELRIIDDFNLNKDDFYKTTLIKCHGKEENIICPYFNLEWLALSECPPKIVICFDEKSANNVEAYFIPRKIQKVNNYRVFCVSSEDDFELILKVIHQQIHNHQTS